MDRRSDARRLDINKSPSVVEDTEQETLLLSEAIDQALEIKNPSIRSSSYPSYKITVKLFTRWAQENKIAAMDIVYFDRLKAVYFDDYLLVECG